jgi:hypothetical protein
LSSRASHIHFRPSRAADSSGDHAVGPSGSTIDITPSNVVNSSGKYALTAMFSAPMSNPQMRAGINGPD